MSDHNNGKLWPTFAFRAWLAALLSQTRRVHERLETRIQLHERIVTRLREKVERSHAVAHSLEEALEAVDNVLRHVRDAEILEEHRGGEPPHPGSQGDVKQDDSAKGRSAAREARTPQGDRKEPRS